MVLPVFPWRIPAGFPSPAEEWIEKRLDLNDLVLLHPTTSFYAQVKGNSMRGAGIRDGDIIVVDRAIEATDTSIVVVQLDGEFTIKRLHLLPDKTLLRAEHPDYPLLDVSSTSDFQVWGVVTCVIHPLTFCVGRPA